MHSEAGLAAMTKTADTLGSAFNSYGDYVRLLIRGSIALATLGRQARFLGLNNEAKRLDQMLHHMEEGAFSIAVIGEFKRGKSTIINALLGSSALPMDVMPATASVTRIVYGRAPQATLIRRDGAHEQISISDLVRHITKIDKEAAERAMRIREAIVAYPTLLCQNNVEIVDTPGLSDEEAMTRLTLDVLPKADAVIFVISVLSPVSQAESDFLCKLLKTIDIGRIFFVLTHIDKLNDPEVVPRLVEAVAKRIGQAVEEAASVAFDVNTLHIYPVSAWDALRGKELHDNVLYQRSRFNELENALEYYLARDRGVAALSQVMQVLRESGITQLSALRSQALQVAHRNEQDAARCQHHQDELDSLFTEVEVFSQGVGERADRCIETVRQTVVDRYKCLLGAVEQVFQNLKISDDLLVNGEARLELVRRHLTQAVELQLDELSRELIALVWQWCSIEDTTLEDINRRLDDKLADCQSDRADAELAKLPVRQKRSPLQSAVALAYQGQAALSDLTEKFKRAFQPLGGFIAGTALGAVGWALGSEAVQETWRTMRKWLDKSTAERAEMRFRESRDQVRERLKAVYRQDTIQHITVIFTQLAFEGKVIAIVKGIALGVASGVAQERNYVVEIIEWRKGELKIERARRHVAHTHKYNELKEMEAETQKLIEETEQQSKLLARALIMGG